MEVSREDSITRFTGKKIDRVIIVLLAVALGYFAFDKFVLSSRWEASLEAQKADGGGRSPEGGTHRGAGGVLW